ncbi:MAG: amine oxidase, partial [Gemmatimonadetes bacterium]|nr:amine oxidase [Gemmatimonadota bacterium]
MSSRPIAVIAGAGPAGLTAAYELLTRTDIQPLIFERTHAIGGIAQTYNYKGNRIDIGGHRFFSKSERVMNWWFSFLPRQGAPAADTEELHHDIDYVAESIVRRIVPPSATDDVLAPDEGGTAVAGGVATREETRVAPDPERTDEVMLHRPRLSRIYYKRHFFPYPIGITFTVGRRLGLLNTALIGISYCKAQLMPLKDESFLDSFFINRFGQRLYESFVRASTE